MPDMQTELSKILNEWDKPIEEINQPTKEVEKQMETTQAPTEGKHLFRTTNNVTRATFNFIRDNPGHTRRGVIDELETFGYKEGSTTSLITQMIKQRLIRKDENGGLHANFPEYTPLKASLKKIMAEKNPRKPHAVKKAKAVNSALHKGEAGIAALQPQATPAPRTALITTNFDVDNILKNLTILQAKALRDALNNLFK